MRQVNRKARAACRSRQSGALVLGLQCCRERVDGGCALRAFRRARASRLAARIRDEKSAPGPADKVPAIARFHSLKHTSRLAPIEECNIALCELHGLIVLDHRASASDLKHGTV